MATFSAIYISAWLQNCEDMISFANDEEQYFEQSDIKKHSPTILLFKKKCMRLDICGWLTYH